MKTGQKIAVLLAAVLGSIGIILGIAGIHIGHKEAVSVSIIGGADGPTSVFLAGKLGNGIALIGLAAGVVAAGIAVWIWRRKQKK